ncbi:MAG: ribonuclease PH [Armatimonadota bacterium]|nr:ribonuclease PH [Armatimonadota bacterium]
MREDGRENGELRRCRITRNINKYAEGSCLISLGNTRVHCTASVDDYQPHWLRDTEEGWVTAEYAMLPRATAERTRRASDRGVSGRAHEIQRLIGRSLRAVCDTKRLGPVTIQLDCDVLQADGGTRTASITGAWVCLADACRWLMDKGRVKRWPLPGQVAAISAGIVGDEVLLDLAYSEDARAAVDMNLVMTGDGRLIEVQGTAEGQPFTDDQLMHMITLGRDGLQTLFDLQREVLGDVLP